VASDVVFLCDKITVFRDTIKGTHCRFLRNWITVFDESTESVLGEILVF